MSSGPDGDDGPDNQDYERGPFDDEPVMPLTPDEEASFWAEYRDKPSKGEEVRELPPFDKEKLTGLIQDREQRRFYAKCCIGLLVLQLLFMNGLMGGVGVGCLKYDPWLFGTYLAGTFGEVAAIVIVVASYLFKRGHRGDPPA